MSGKNKSICLVSLRALAALRGDLSGHIGGIERQISIMARWLADHGWDTSVIVWDESQEDHLIIENVRIIKICREDAGFKGVRFFYPRWSGLISAMCKADASVYYQLGASHSAGQIALWCRLRRRKFVFGAASDTNVRRDLPGLKTRNERLFYRLGLKLADEIIVQSGWQSRTLKSDFRLSSHRMPMPCPGPTEDSYRPKSFPQDRKKALWVARISPVKRLNWLLDVAELCPTIQFDIVGPSGSSKQEYQSVERAKRAGNVVFHGAIEREVLDRLYEASSILCCTSSREGFPNTFLEAWSRGLPVASTLEIDDLLEGKGLGFVRDVVAEFAARLNQVLDSEEEWRSMSEKGRAYYVEYHLPDSAMGHLVGIMGSGGVTFEECGVSPASI